MQSMVKIFWLVGLLCRIAKEVHANSCYKSTSMMNATTDFFSYYDFITEDDPTHGYVDFISQSEAEASGLVAVRDNQIYIGVDHQNNVEWGARGRKAIRLSSHQVLEENSMVIFDVAHMPTTAKSSSLAQGCSLWPAFWTFGPEWPNSGEIDIIEYVNTDSTVLTSLHTSANCDESRQDSSSFTGSWALGDGGRPDDNCDVNAWDQYSNSGCGIVNDATSTVGAAFNDATNGLGGVFAMEWSSAEIRSFYFPRDSVPEDITSHAPNPDLWGTPYARFSFGSDADCSADHFKSHNIIFDTTFCGDWAGAVFGDACSWEVSCTDYVAYNPSDFTEAFWLVNYVETFASC